MNNDEKNTISEEKKDYDDLLIQYNKHMDTIRELEEIIRALLYVLRITNVERLVNKDESCRFQEAFAEERKRANKLFDELERLKNE